MNAILSFSAAQELLFNASALAQLVIDPIDNRIIAANQECCRLFGKDVGQILAFKASEVFSPSFDTFVVFTQEAIAQGRAWSDQLNVEFEDQILELEVNAVYRHTGDQTLLFMSMQTVSEVDHHRERSEANRHYQSGIGHWHKVSRIFQEFEYEHQLLLDAAGEGIYGVDTEGTTTFTNPAAQKILGYSAEELAGRNMHTMVHHSHSDGSQFCVQDCPIFRAFKIGEVQHVEHDIFWSKEGTPIDVEYTSTPIKENNEIVGAVVVFHDVTQKKAFQRQLLFALEEVKTLKNRLEMEKAYLQEEIRSEFNHHQLIGNSPALKQVLQQIDLVGPTDATVLIYGESGTGKELIARALHDSSDRASRPLIRVNCAAIPEDLFESEFFGHVRGAFTGASSDRPGRFELADGGSLFLDEVGEIPLHLQGKLLRVLQEQQLERIGDNKTRSVNVRIIAATNRDLKALVEAGKFREDLYFRLNVFPIESAPLRERREDIPLLTQHFLAKASTRTNKSALKIPLAEIEKLKHYNWPGNIRELENVVERQVILTRGDTVRFDTLTTTNLLDISDKRTDTNLLDQCDSRADSTNDIMTDAQLRQLEHQNILRALTKSKGKVFGEQGAATLLGLKPTTLSSRMKKLGIRPPSN